MDGGAWVCLCSTCALPAGMRNNESVVARAAGQLSSEPSNAVLSRRSVIQDGEPYIIFTERDCGVDQMIDIQKFREGRFTEDRIGYALRGENPTQIARMSSGFVFLMDRQFLPGWCVLTAYPQVRDLNDLPFAKRNEYLTDMQLLGEAIAFVTQPVRMNYSILGNTDNYLHAHVYPRYAWETPDRLRRPAWFYPDEYWRNPEYQLNESHVELAGRIQAKLEELRNLYTR